MNTSQNVHKRESARYFLEIEYCAQQTTGGACVFILEYEPSRVKLHGILTVTRIMLNVLPTIVTSTAVLNVAGCYLNLCLKSISIIFTSYS